MRARRGDLELLVTRHVIPKRTFPKVTTSASTLSTLQYVLLFGSTVSVICSTCQLALAEMDQLHRLLCPLMRLHHGLVGHDIQYHIQKVLKFSGRSR